MKSIAVFCGSSPTVPTTQLEQAYVLGSELAKRGVELIYGAGATGLMGRVADGVLEHSGRVTGVIPFTLDGKEITHDKLTVLEKVDSFATRKARMNELSEAFLVLQGGLGTLDEFFEMWTERQLAYHDKPIYLLNVDGFYDHFLKFFEQAGADGYLHSNAMEKIQIFQSLREFLDHLDQ